MVIELTSPPWVKGQSDAAEGQNVGPDLTEMPRTTACPSCGAALRPDAPWCTLCYADLRPAPPPEPLPDPEPVPTAVPATASYRAPAADPLTQPLVDLLPERGTANPSDEVTWPCADCGTRNPLSASVCTGCGAGFLAAVAEQGRPSLVLPVIGDLSRLSRGQRLGAAFGAVAAVLVPLALLTLLLTGSPPKDHGTTTTVVNQPLVSATP